MCHRVIDASIDWEAHTRHAAEMSNVERWATVLVRDLVAIAHKLQRVVNDESAEEGRARVRASRS